MAILSPDWGPLQIKQGPLFLTLQEMSWSLLYSWGYQTRLGLGFNCLASLSSNECENQLMVFVPSLPHSILVFSDDLKTLGDTIWNN